MEPIIYLRDCIFDKDCDPESNIETDLETRKLWFIKASTKSDEYHLDSGTPLLSSHNKPYTLYQLYLFTTYLKERDWADYVMETGMAEQEPHNSAYLITPIAESANIDCDELYNYLSGNIHVHNGLHQPTPTPKPLQIVIGQHKKRKIDSGINNLSSQPPNKKQKLTQNSSLKDEINLIEELHSNHNNTDSLFTENYDVNNLEIMDESKPFWMSLSDPSPSAMDNNINDTINWKDEYRTRIRESATRNTILNSLNNKSFGEIAKEFPKISRSLQKLIQSGGTKGIKIKSSNAERIRKTRTEAPIIIVPYSNNSLLTFSNCLPFLKENKYIYNSNKPLYNNNKKNKGLKNGNSATRINLQIKSLLDPHNKKPAVFEIRSSSSFTKNTSQRDWDRIAAIFVIGKAWQFKKWITGWKEPEVIFSKTVGFYMHFKDDPPNEVVKNWRVNYLPIMRNQRHDDARIAKQFWSKLYDHLKSKHRNKKLFF